MEINNYAPVVVFVYNRPEHTKKMLARLNELDEVQHTTLYIFADAPKDDFAKLKVNEVETVIRNFIRISKFNKVYFRKNEKNFGLAQSIIKGVSHVIEMHGKAIVLEDDLIVSKDFLRYMNTGLEKFKNDKTIWSISGYTFPLESLKKSLGDVYMSDRGCSWGWATWDDRWKTVDWDVKDYSKFKFNIVLRHHFAKWGYDLPCLLDAYKYGEIQSWAIRWCYSAFKQGKRTIYPKNSRVVNIGTDGSGTNFSKKEDRYNTYLYNGNDECQFKLVEESENIRREFASRYITGGELIKLHIRWFLIRLGILRIKSK